MVADGKEVKTFAISTDILEHMEKHGINSLGVWAMETYRREHMTEDGVIEERNRLKKRLEQVELELEEIRNHRKMRLEQMGITDGEKEVLIYYKKLFDEGYDIRELHKKFTKECRVINFNAFKFFLFGGVGDGSATDKPETL
jgi:hypothetical protein